MQGALTVSGGLRQQFDADLFRRFIDYTDVKETTLKGYAVCIRAFARWASETGTMQPQREDIKSTWKRRISQPEPGHSTCGR